jgi:hypothetical protein
MTQVSTECGSLLMHRVSGYIPALMQESLGGLPIRWLVSGRLSGSMKHSRGKVLVSKGRHQMQDVHITCKWDQLQSMVRGIEEQFEAQKEEVTVLDWGTSYKKEAGYIVLEWEDEVDPTFIDQLTTDNDVEDFCVYTVPCITDGQLRILESAELEGI